MKKETKKKQSQDVPVDEELKKILKKHEQNELLFSPETLLPERSRAEQLEKEALSQKGLPLINIRNVINDLAVPCEPMFPNNKPFFKLMYKLLKWDHLDPNEFIKPPCVARYIKNYIYARFTADVLPSLMSKDNPFTVGYIKKYKLYWFLNSEGLLLLEQFIKQAIAVMETSTSWYDFELKYAGLYKLSVQTKLNLK